MYWPIGAPRVYAASTVAAPKNLTQESDDDATTPSSSPPLSDDTAAQIAGTPPTGLCAGSETERSISPPDGAPLDDQDGRTEVQKHEVKRHDKGDPKTSTQKEKEAIIDLKVARQGHLFATITSDALTVWQTQV